MFTLDLDQPVADAVRAAFSDRVEHARARVPGIGDGTRPRDSSVHEVRKDLKKVRSLLRLVRGEIPSSSYRELSGRLRDAQRAVSEVRDAEALVGTVEQLAEHFVGRLSEKAFEEVRRPLAEDAARALGPDWRGLAAELEATLQSALARVETLPLDEVDLDGLLGGAARSYSRGRRAYVAARRHPSTEALHELRKRVKDHWYHQSLLSDLFPLELRASAEAAHQLSDLLGDDHDLAVLDERLHAPASPAPVLEADLEALVDERRRELQSGSMSLAQRIYAEKPKPHRRRMRKYLDALTAERPLAA